MGKGKSQRTSTHSHDYMYAGIVSPAAAAAAALSWWSPLLQSAQLPSLSTVALTQHSLSPGHQSVASDSEQDMRK